MDQHVYDEEKSEHEGRLLYTKSSIDVSRYPANFLFELCLDVVVNTT